MQARHSDGRYGMGPGRHLVKTSALRAEVPGRTRVGRAALAAGPPRRAGLAFTTPTIASPASNCCANARMRLLLVRDLQRPRR